MLMFCFENVIIQFGEKFYKQKIGIITGDNRFLSLVNIVMHIIIEVISENLKQTELFRRYINNIFFISFGPSNTKSMQTALTNIFQNNGLTLTFREVNNRQSGQSVKFLYVFLQIKVNNPNGFVKKISPNQQQQDERFYTEIHTIHFIFLKISFSVQQ